MYKLITLPGYDNRTGPHIFPISTDVDTSIGHIKMARPLPPAIEHYIRTAKPITGKTQLLIDALGAGEYFGSNSNGDYFPEEALKHKGPAYGYETFMHYAYPFKHHCFPAETLVLMADGSRKPICDVQEGELVATLSGPRQVEASMRRRYSGGGVSMTIQGEPTPLVGTSDHPVLVYRRETLHCPHRYSYLAENFGCEYKECKSRSATIGDPEWTPLSKVLPGDYLVSPRPQHGDVDVDPTFARFVGWVASDGHLSPSGCIQFTFSQNSRFKIESVKECLASLGISSKERPRNDGLVSVYGSSVELSRRLSEYVSGTLGDKTLTEKIMSWSEDSLLHMLGGYIDGDGSIAKHGRNRGVLRIRSSSKKMLYRLSTVIRSLGTWSAVNYDCPPGTMISPTNDKVYHTEGSGVVTVSKQESPKIAKYSQKRVDVQCSRAQRIHWNQNLLFARVSDIDHLDLDEDVFNLEVEGVHHYVANNVVVHNCNRDPARAYGDKVTLSAYDDYMHRVLLIVRVDDHKCSDILGDLEGGHYWSVSMGCKVPWDECSICKNRARNRREYCPHLRYQMNRILQDGRRVCAYNWLPKFFDISFVTIGAEKASHVLKKVASAQSIITLNSAALGEQYYAKLANAEKAAEQRKRAEIEKDVPSVPPANISGVTDEDKQKLSDLSCCAGPIKSVETPIPDNKLDEIASFPLRDIFATLATLGIDLRPHEFQRVVLVQQGARPLADKLASMRCVFDESRPAKTIPKWASSARNFTENNVNEKIAMILAPYMRARSCYPEVLLNRLRQMEKTGEVRYNRNSQWFPLNEEEKQRSSGLSGLVPASLALAAGFMVFRQAFPSLIGKAPTAVRAIAKHPWLLPLLLSAGVGASVGISTMSEPRALTPQGTGVGLDGKKPSAYDGTKTASMSSIAHFGPASMAYIFASVQPHAVKVAGREVQGPMTALDAAIVDTARRITR